MEQNFPTIQTNASILVNDTYSYINNTTFYSLTNKTYFDYYYRVVRKVAWWLDGYVPTFHNAGQGIFSTRLASSIVKGVGNQITGKKILFKGAKGSDGRALDFISKTWQEKADFQNAVRNAIKYSTGLGTSLLKLNKSSKDLWLEAVRLDYFYFESDFRGELVDVTCLIKKYANNNTSRNQDTPANNYYLVERRYFVEETVKKTEKIGEELKVFVEKKRVPKVIYQVHQYSGLTLTQAFDPSLKQTLRWDSIPKNVQKSIKSDYRVIDIGVEQTLPFSEHLGCVLMKFDDNDISLPQTPFGTSLIYDIMSYLMTYDLAWSYYVRDLYLGKGSILIPKPLTNPSDVGFVGVFAGLDKSVYELLPSLDPDKMTPTPIQFNLRTAEWIQTQDNILKKIATTIGMSPKTIAGYLDDAQGQKTATEIDAEDDATIAFIEIKRGIYERALNKLVELVTNHYGFSDNIEIRFATPSLVNQDKVIERAIRLMESGLADEEEALQMIYPDDDERQLQERVAKMKAKKQELEQKQQMMNPYGIG